MTVLLPVGKDITVTFSLLGDSVHGNSGDKHTLADGNLEKWIDGVTVTVGNNATVLDVITKALGSKYIIENKTGNYIQSITPKDGKALGEFTNGPLSGWMYTLNGKHSNLGVAQQYLMNGDVIVFHYTDDYNRENVKAKADANERLHRAKVTDNARVILALTAIGKDVTNVGGHNLLKGLDSMDYIQTQGINGPIWALIALDSHNYPTSGDVTREKLIETILGAVLEDGGWTLSGTKADPDMTAMAIQALAPYYKTNETVKAAVDKALEALSALQRNDGGFGSWGTVNSESCAQVIVALTALGIDPTADSRFVKNGLTVLDALASFYVTGGGFRHTAGGDLDGMATEQGYYALAAYYRFVNAQTRLYDMTDVTVQTGGSNTPATGDTGVLVWVIALPVTILTAAFVLKRKEREA